MNLRLNQIYKKKLFFQNKYYYCQVGENGIVPSYKKKEGDKSTPKGRISLRYIYIRKDKKNKIKISRFLRNRIISIKKNFIWHDDIKSRNYNKFCELKDSVIKKKLSFENLYRKDDVYDIIVELGYNQKPTIKNKGSAIFIHCSFKDKRPTLGCIALKKKNLEFIINNLQKEKYIYIK
mgnify:CR=1 FL=1